MAAQCRLPAKVIAYEGIKRDILVLKRPPGSSLEEGELCAAYDLSRTPLREVLQQLAGEGYVTLHQNRGARVSDMSHVTVRDFFLAAPLVYSAIMRLAARNATTEQIGALKAAQAAFRQAVESGGTADRALTNDAFHRITGDMAGNQYLTISLERLLIDHTRIAMTFFEPATDEQVGRHDLACRQHDAMIDALQNRDEERAAALALEHWALSRDQIERFVMPDGLSGDLGELPKQNSA